MRAIERGVVTGTRKTLHQGKAVITFALGSERLYEFIDNNPFIEGHPVDYVNDPFVSSQNDRLVAINSAIEVDLTGQVCSDSIGSYIYSGFGGQVDFIRGAARSAGGRPIIALPSSAKRGTMSRIVPFLKEGAGVVTSRADVHYVVTEHGVANLFGKNLRERAEALIAIADPAFQDELVEAAKERKLRPSAPARPDSRGHAVRPRRLAKARPTARCGPPVSRSGGSGRRRRRRRALRAGGTCSSTRCRCPAGRAG